MKNTLFCLVALSALLVSCGSDKSENTDKSVFETYSVHHFYKMSSTDSESFPDSSFEPYSEIKMLIQWPEMIQGKTPEVLQKEILASLFADSVTTVQAGIDATLAKPLGYEDDASVTQTEVDSIPQDYSSYLYADVAPIFMGEKIYTFEINTSSYMMGAAHGMYGKQFISYDIDSEKVIELSDIFSNKDAVLPIITTQLEMTYGQDDNCINYDDVTVTDNFYIDGNSICFCYNPYEVACYAQGIVLAKIDFYKFMGTNLLTPYGKELFGITE